MKKIRILTFYVFLNITFNWSNLPPLRSVSRPSKDSPVKKAAAYEIIPNIVVANILQLCQICWRVNANLENRRKLNVIKFFLPDMSEGLWWKELLPSNYGTVNKKKYEACDGQNVTLNSLHCMVVCLYLNYKSFLQAKCVVIIFANNLTVKSHVNKVLYLPVSGAPNKVIT